MPARAGPPSVLRIARTRLASQLHPCSVHRAPDRPRTFSTTPGRLQVLANHYATLGVTQSADSGTIKGAYYKLAKTYHPDLNKASGASDKFLAIQKAYDTLSDHSKRRAYDRDHMPSPVSSIRRNSRPKYYDPFSFGDHRTSYTYDDLKRAAEGRSAFTTTEDEEWTDATGGSDGDRKSSFGRWSDSEFASGYAAFTADAWGGRTRSKAEQEFDDFLAQVAMDASRTKMRRRPGGWQYAPNPNSQRSKRREEARRIRKFKARTPAQSRPGHGPKAAINKALHRERDSMAADNRKRREAEGRRRGKGEYNATVRIPKQAARVGTVLHRVAVNVAGLAGMECALCHGSGAFHTHVKAAKCTRCRGKGHVVVRSLRGDKQRVDCVVCEATGFKAKIPRPHVCPGCDGTGAAHGKGGKADTMSIRVKVPPGTRDQDVLRIPIGKGGAASALVQVRIASS